MSQAGLCNPKEVLSEARPDRFLFLCTSLDRWQRSGVGAGCELEGYKDSAAAGISSAAAQADCVAEWHGGVPPGGSRTASRRWHRPHSRRGAFSPGEQDRTDGYLWRSLAHGWDEIANRRSTR